MLTVYTKNNCSYCERAKHLLESKGVKYELKNIESNPDFREFLINKGLRSVPQIFDGDNILPGGYQGLVDKPQEFWEEKISKA
jgi:glutaredoxin